MDIKELDGVYQLSVKTNAGGAYSEKPVTGDICIQNGNIKGLDELSVMWCGYVECADGEHVKYHITIDPAKAPETIITRKRDGMMTDEYQSFEGNFKIAQKEDGSLMLSSFETMAEGEYNALVSMKRVSQDIECAVCKGE